MNLIAYPCIPDDSRTVVFTATESVLVPFLNGEYGRDELLSIWCDILGAESGNRRDLGNRLDSILQDWGRIGLVGVKGFPSPSISADLQAVLPDYGSYTFSAHRLERPISVGIAFTNSCRYNCRYCFAERNYCTDLSLDVWRKFFHQLTRNEIFRIDICGGDIFARNDSINILEEMVGRDFVFFLSTKSNISKEVARRLREFEIGMPTGHPHLQRPIQISLDAVDDDVASSLVGCQNYFYTARTSIANLLEQGISPRLKCVITPFNVREPPKLIEYFTGMGVEEFQFVQYSRSHYRHDERLFLSYEQKRFIAEMAETIRCKYPNIRVTFQQDMSAGGPKNLSEEEWGKRSTCSGGRTACIVHPNGDMTLCDQLPHQKEFVVGNVFKTPIEEIWKSKMLVDLIYPSRSKFQGTVCYSCSGYEECHRLKGYCFRDSFLSYGTIYDAPPNCPRQKTESPRMI